MQRLAVIIVLVAAIGVFLLAIGWHPVIYSWGDGLWIGVIHPIGGPTPQPVMRGSHAIGFAGMYVGRGWRTQRQSNGLYTLSAMDGGFVPYWFMAVLCCFVAGAVSWVLRRTSRRSSEGFEVVER